MGYKIEGIEGIGPVYGAKLVKAGIKTTTGFLKACASRKGRKEVAGQTGISETLLLEWANHADLMRIKGVGPEFSDLLEAAGVDTVKELRKRKPQTLAAKLAEVKEAKKLTRVTPSLAQVEQWVAEANELPPVITH